MTGSSTMRRARRSLQGLPVRQSEIRQMQALTPVAILLLAVPLWKVRPSPIKLLLGYG